MSCVDRVAPIRMSLSGLPSPGRSIRLDAMGSSDCDRSKEQDGRPHDPSLYVSTQHFPPLALEKVDHVEIRYGSNYWRLDLRCPNQLNDRIRVAVFFRSAGAGLNAPAHLIAHSTRPANSCDSVLQGRFSSPRPPCDSPVLPGPSCVTSRGESARNRSRWSSINSSAAGRRWIVVAMIISDLSTFRSGSHCPGSPCPEAFYRSSGLRR